MKPNRILLGLVLVGAVLWGGYRAYRAHLNLVTLNVRNMEVRKVISKLEWQTWERILVNKDVSGMVTLNVESVPLDEVLNIVGLQTDSRWTALYPIYSSSKSEVAFKKVVRGDLTAEDNGWSNLQKIPNWQKSVANGFANTARSENKLVSAQIANKDLNFAALALSRFSRALVVPEDGANGTINLKLEQVPFNKAVARVAKQAHRKWDEIYALQPLRTALAMRKETNDVSNGTATATVTKRVQVTKPDEMTNAPEIVAEAMMATMTPEQRKEAQERMQTMQQIQALPDGERQQRMQEMAAQAKQASQAGLEERIQQRLKNGTVDQRIAHDRQKLSKQQADPKK
ncbi:MAG: hypothetical protein JWM99_4105 [Verrucomicrobiales bacterium]|jgi:hypothetical protein|nr:hypothetical protein [Verrucomicrobiales bacterium]